ncbi:type II toxin-antitoxin system VapC family toxin [Candidatus Micrarchaeota archaeon]|nr:type II toxin-antitoxin system VapC family toxin [Candidatus Micrarchaeota archaeon]
MTVTFDSYAWIEYFSGSKKGEKVKEIIDGSGAILTPSVCLLEIKAKYLREGKEHAGRIEFICFRSKIVELNKEIALRAADEKNDKKLHAADAIVYATAMQNNSILLTGDQHLKNLEGVDFL